MNQVLKDVVSLQTGAAVAPGKKVQMKFMVNLEGRVR